MADSALAEVKKLLAILSNGPKLRASCLNDANFENNAKKRIVDLVQSDKTVRMFFRKQIDFEWVGMSGENSGTVGFRKCSAVKLKKNFPKKIFG